MSIPQYYTNDTILLFLFFTKFNLCIYLIDWTWNDLAPKIKIVNQWTIQISHVISWWMSPQRFSCSSLFNILSRWACRPQTHVAPQSLISLLWLSILTSTYSAETKMASKMVTEMTLKQTTLRSPIINRLHGAIRHPIQLTNNVLGEYML